MSHKLHPPRKRHHSDLDSSPVALEAVGFRDHERQKSYEERDWGFLCLPGEIRNQIYELIIDTSSAPVRLELHDKNCIHSRDERALAATCSKVRLEFLPLAEGLRLWFYDAHQHDRPSKGRSHTCSGTCLLPFFRDGIEDNIRHLEIYERFLDTSDHLRLFLDPGDEYLRQMICAMKEAGLESLKLCISYSWHAVAPELGETEDLVGQELLRLMGNKKSCVLLPNELNEFAPHISSIRASKWSKQWDMTAVWKKEPKEWIPSTDVSSNDAPLTDVHPSDDDSPSDDASSTDDASSPDNAFCSDDTSSCDDISSCDDENPYDGESPTDDDSLLDDVSPVKT